VDRHEAVLGEQPGKAIAQRSRRARRKAENERG
jgi:hypothetical protein